MYTLYCEGYPLVMNFSKPVVYDRFDHKNTDNHLNVDISENNRPPERERGEKNQLLD